MKESIIYTKSRNFAIRILKLEKYLVEEKEYVISKQIVRSGTSIGANVREGLQGQSTADFISKFSIALKEASETDYWLDLLQAADYINQDQYNSLLADLTEILKLLTSIIKTTKNNNKKE